MYHNTLNLVWVVVTLLRKHGNNRSCKYKFDCNPKIDFNRFLQDAILAEAQELVSYMETLNGEPSELGMQLNVAGLNVIWQLVACE